MVVARLGVIKDDKCLHVPVRYILIFDEAMGLRVVW